MNDGGSNPYSNPFGSNNPFGSGANPYGTPPHQGMPAAGGVPAFGMPAGGQTSYSPAPRTDGMAVTSLVAACISPFFYCLCCLSIVPAFVAIVTGHVSLVRIKRSQGMLTGRGLALAGLGIGYAVFVGSLFAIGYQLVTFKDRVAEEQRRRESDDPQDVGEREAEKQLRRAEALIDNGDQTKAYGNSPEAESMALAMATLMKKFRDEYFTKRRQAPTNTQFVTYCSRKPDSCAFLIYVPEYRKFDDDAKKSLADIAWLAAQEICADKLSPGDELAIGMKGQFLFGAIRLGEVAGPNGDLEAHETGKREDLLPFFDLAPAPNAPDLNAIPGPLDPGAPAEQEDPFRAP